MASQRSRSVGSPNPSFRTHPVRPAPNTASGGPGEGPWISLPPDLPRGPCQELPWSPHRLHLAGDRLHGALPSAVACSTSTPSTHSGPLGASGARLGPAARSASSPWFRRVSSRRRLPGPRTHEASPPPSIPNPPRSLGEGPEVRPGPPRDRGQMPGSRSAWVAPGGHDDLRLLVDHRPAVGPARTTLGRPRTARSLVRAR